MLVSTRRTLARISLAPGIILFGAGAVMLAVCIGRTAASILQCSSRWPWYSLPPRRGFPGSATTSSPGSRPQLSHGRERRSGLGRVTAIDSATASYQTLVRLRLGPPSRVVELGFSGIDLILAKL